MAAASVLLLIAFGLSGSYNRINHPSSGDKQIAPASEASKQIAEQQEEAGQQIAEHQHLKQVWSKAAATIQFRGKQSIKQQDFQVPNQTQAFIGPGSLASIFLWLPSIPETP